MVERNRHDCPSMAMATPHPGKQNSDHRPNVSTVRSPVRRATPDNSTRQAGILAAGRAVTESSFPRNCSPGNGESPTGVPESAAEVRVLVADRADWARRRLGALPVARTSKSALRRPPSAGLRPAARRILVPHSVLSKSRTRKSMPRAPDPAPSAAHSCVGSKNQPVAPTTRVSILGGFSPVSFSTDQ